MTEASYLDAETIFDEAAHDYGLESYADEPIERLLFDWTWMSLFFNRVNTAMGKNPLYPFDISPPVADKLGFVHTVVRHGAEAHRAVHNGERSANSNSA